MTLANRFFFLSFFLQSILFYFPALLLGWHRFLGFTAAWFEGLFGKLGPAQLCALFGAPDRRLWARFHFPVPASTFGLLPTVTNPPSCSCQFFRGRAGAPVPGGPLDVCWALSFSFPPQPKFCFAALVSNRPPSCLPLRLARPGWDLLDECCPSLPSHGRSRLIDFGPVHGGFFFRDKLLSAGFPCAPPQ